jgi:hypothetical protein
MRLQVLMPIHILCKSKKVQIRKPIQSESTPISRLKRRPSTSGIAPPKSSHFFFKKNNSSIDYKTTKAAIRNAAAAARSNCTTNRFALHCVLRCLNRYLQFLRALLPESNNFWNCNMHTLRNYNNDRFGARSSDKKAAMLSRGRRSSTICCLLFCLFVCIVIVSSLSARLFAISHLILLLLHRLLADNATATTLADLAAVVRRYYDCKAFVV